MEEKSASQGAMRGREDAPSSAQHSAGLRDLFELYECELSDIADVIDERLAGRCGAEVFRIAHLAGHWACLSAFVRGAQSRLHSLDDGAERATPGNSGMNK